LFLLKLSVQQRTDDAGPVLPLGTRYWLPSGASPFSDPLPGGLLCPGGHTGGSWGRLSPKEKPAAGDGAELVGLRGPAWSCLAT